MKEHDNKQLYEVNKLQDCVGKDSFGFEHEQRTHTILPEKKWILPITIAVSLITVLVLIVVLQSVTVVQLHLLPSHSECPETPATTDTQAGCTDDWSRQSAINMQQLLAQIYNMSRDIMNLGDEQLVHAQNNTELLKEILKTTQASAQKLTEIVHTLSNFKDSDSATAGVINDILLVVNELLNLQKNSTLFPSHTSISCQDIRDSDAGNPSGYYQVNDKLTYCEMGELCGHSGGWTRLAYLDMSDATVDCPPGWQYYDLNGVRACGRPSGGASCTSVTHPSNGVTYSQLCGRVTGYQKGSPEAVDTSTVLTLVSHDDINSFYVDGVSITRGHPRQHVWTLMGGTFEVKPNAGNCPCSTIPGAYQDVQSFVGNDYFCESGNPDQHVQNGNNLYSNDPLWDGKGCVSQEGSCCTAPGLPWFHRSFNSTTTDYIEIRVCGDQDSESEEDVPINFYEIYVK